MADRRRLRVLEKGRLAEGGVGSSRGGLGAPFEAQLSQEFLDGYLSVKHFNLRGVFELQPFHAHEFISRSLGGPRKHTGNA